MGRLDCGSVNWRSRYAAACWCHHGRVDCCLVCAQCDDEWLASVMVVLWTPHKSVGNGTRGLVGRFLHRGAADISADTCRHRMGWCDCYCDIGGNIWRRGSFSRVDCHYSCPWDSGCFVGGRRCKRWTTRCSWNQAIAMDRGTFVFVVHVALADLDYR